MSKAVEVGRRFLQMADSVTPDMDPGWAVAAATAGLLAMQIETVAAEEAGHVRKDREALDRVVEVLADFEGSLSNIFTREYIIERLRWALDGDR